MARLKDIEKGYIVDKTKGSSNELSFNVLQGKANTAVDAKAPNPWEINPEAVAKKRNSRRRGKIIAALAGVAGVLALGIVVILMIAGFLQEQNGSITSLNDGISKVLDLSDENAELRSDLQIILTSDGDGINNSNVMQNYETVLKEATNRKATLQERRAEIEQLQSQIATPTEKEAANNAMLLIDAEISIIDCAVGSQGYVTEFLEKRELSIEGMNLLVDSDSKDREASSSLTAQNTDEAQKAVTSANEGKEMASQAKAKFEALAELDSRFEEYVTFADLKVQANAATAAAAQAYIDRNKEELKTQNDKYNDLQTQATDISSKWERELYEVFDEEFSSARENDAKTFEDDLKNRDSIYQTVQNYLNSR